MEKRNLNDLSIKLSPKKGFTEEISMRKSFNYIDKKSPGICREPEKDNCILK